MMVLQHILAVPCEMFQQQLSSPTNRYRRIHCMAFTLARFESSGFLPVGTPKCSSC
jgi:hypothetical protein